MLDHCGNNHNSMLGTLLPDIRNIILLYVPFDGIFVCVLDALTWLGDLLHLDLNKQKSLQYTSYYDQDIQALVQSTHKPPSWMSPSCSLTT